MAVKKFNPTSPSRRFMTVSDFAEITRSEPEKSLVEPKSRINGRNNMGRITVRRRGGGHKRKYRVIDFRRDKEGVPGKVAAIEYDPNRTANIALLHYADGEKRYILAPQGVQVGMTLTSGTGAEPITGNSMRLADIPVGLQIHNIELHPGKGGQMCRSAGVAAQLTAREGDYAAVLLSSGELRLVHTLCRATIGRVGNADQQNIKLGKAGRNRWRGRKPKVRGVAKSHHCHPLGGGEGRSKSGREPASASGTKSKGGRTRGRGKWSDRLILRRRRSRRYGQLKL